MEKVQIQTEIDIQKLLAQLNTSQLEACMREISALIRLRSTTDKTALEARLLQQLNEACVLPLEDWREFTQLKEKREAESISEAELSRLAELIQQEERLRLKRVELLGALAELREISLPVLMKELGIQPPQSV